jgi:hypothetical protein
MAAAAPKRKREDDEEDEDEPPPKRPKTAKTTETDCKVCSSTPIDKREVYNCNLCPNSGRLNHAATCQETIKRKPAILCLFPDPTTGSRAFMFLDYMIVCMCCLSAQRNCATCQCVLLGADASIVSVTPGPTDEFSDFFEFLGPHVSQEVDDGSYQGGIICSEKPLPYQHFCSKCRPPGFGLFHLNIGKPDVTLDYRDNGDFLDDEDDGVHTS